MGRASKNRGPIGLLRAGPRTARSAGERKAPCSLAPWQLLPKASAAGDVPKCGAHQGKGASRRTTLAARDRLKEPGEPLHGVRPARHADDSAPVLVSRGDRAHL